MRSDFGTMAVISSSGDKEGWMRSGDKEWWMRSGG